MKASQLLRGAVPFLARDFTEAFYTGKNVYTCHAIDKCARSMYGSSMYGAADRAAIATASADLVRYINVLLCPEAPKSMTLACWVLDNVPGAIALKDYHPDKWLDQIQAYRHRWVQHLIKEFEAKGE